MHGEKRMGHGALKTVSFSIEKYVGCVLRTYIRLVWGPFLLLTKNSRDSEKENRG
jgi:hypothetical protein